MNITNVKNIRCNGCSKTYHCQNGIEINLNGIITRLCEECAKELHTKLNIAIKTIIAIN